MVLYVLGVRICSVKSTPKISKNSNNIPCFCLMPSATRLSFSVRLMLWYFLYSKLPHSSSLFNIFVTLDALTFMWRDMSSVVSYTSALPVLQLFQDGLPFACLNVFAPPNELLWWNLVFLSFLPCSGSFRSNVILSDKLSRHRSN